jgi:hypothetical protein
MEITQKIAKKIIEKVHPALFAFFIFLFMVLLSVWVKPLWMVSLSFLVILVVIVYFKIAQSN